jgi:hypothetical protein
MEFVLPSTLFKISRKFDPSDARRHRRGVGQVDTTRATGESCNSLDPSSPGNPAGRSYGCGRNNLRRRWGRA